MPTKLICGGEKYELGGPKLDTIGLPVYMTNLPAIIEIEGYTLSLKTEFHVSLVCIGKIAEKNKIDDPDIVKKIVDDFCEFTQNNKVDLLRYRNNFKFVTRDNNRSAVVICDISNLDKFFDLLNQKYALELEYSPPHPRNSIYIATKYRNFFNQLWRYFKNGQTDWYPNFKFQILTF
mgnify:CR=1 FL=1